MGVDM